MRVRSRQALVLFLHSNRINYWRRLNRSVKQLERIVYTTSCNSPGGSSKTYPIVLVLKLTDPVHQGTFHSQVVAPTRSAGCLAGTIGRYERVEPRVRTVTVLLSLYWSAITTYNIRLFCHSGLKCDR